MCQAEAWSQFFCNLRLAFPNLLCFKHQPSERQLVLFKSIQVSSRDLQSFPFRQRALEDVERLHPPQRGHTKNGDVERRTSCQTTAPFLALSVRVCETQFTQRVLLKSIGGRRIDSFKLALVGLPETRSNKSTLLLLSLLA